MSPAWILLITLAVSPAASHHAANLARRSMLEYDMGQLEQALSDSQAAYLLDPRPTLLFNLGQCHRALKHWALAEELFRNYLRRDPNAPNRAQTEKLIDEMVAKQQPAPAPESGAKPAADGRARARAASTSREREKAPSDRGPRDVARETPSVARTRGPRLAAASPPSAERALRPAPAAAVTAPAAHRGHALAWGLGAGAAACAAVAVTGIVEVEDYAGLVGQAQQTQDWQTFQRRSAQARSGRGAAQAWQVAAIAAAVATVALGVGMGLTW